MKLSLSDAFARFKAQPRNIRSSVSAFSPDGVLVLSLWAHYFDRTESGPIYADRLSRWTGSGNTWLRQDLERAQQEGSHVQAIVAVATDTTVVDAGGDASKIKKEFHIPKWGKGKLLMFDGDEFVIQFSSVGT